MTDQDKDKPKDIPMPVPSIGADKTKIKPKTEVQDKIDHDSDQSIPATPIPPTDQIDTGEPPSQHTSGTPVSPPPKDKEPDDEDSGAPSLPFTGGDPMAQAGDDKPKPKSPKIKNPPAIPGKVNDMDLDRQMEDKKAENWLTKRGDSYKVHGKERPDAASIQRVSNNKGVCTEVLSATQTDEYAEAIVRAHLGSIYVDAVVHHCFENYRRLLILEMINKNPDILDSWNGEMPVIKAGATIKDAGGKIKDAQYTIMHSYFSFIQFALRDATTKAEAAAQAKILNKEFREKEDIESEQFERDLINS